MAAQNPNFIFTGLDAFWRVQDALSRDRNPSPQQWRRLFSDPGYVTLFHNDPAFSEGLLREKFSLAYRPSRGAERLRALGSGEDRLLQHYVRVGQRREDIDGFLADWSQRDVAGEARAAAARFLPRAPLKKLRDPKVSFLVFKSDARGYSRVLLDPLGALERPDPVLLLGHEFHHFFRSRMPGVRRVSIADRDRVRLLLSLVETEGIADLINRPPIFHRAGPLRPADKTYVRWVEVAPELLKAVDGALCICSRMPEVQDEMADALLNLLPDGGHQLGFYMAREIARRLGLGAVLRCVGRPSCFFLAYQRAALLSRNTPRFGKETVRFLKRLGSANSA